MGDSKRLRRGAELLLPHGVMLFRQRRGRAYVLAERRHRLEAGTAALAAQRASQFSFEEAIRFLVDRGLPEHTVRDGSMPQQSLDYLGSFVRELPREHPLLALHIGNFVGVSLAHMADVLRQLHPGSVVVSVDPDITHRGVPYPARHVVALLGQFRLLQNHLGITGYTLEQNVGDDSGADPTQLVAEEQRAEHVLVSLDLLARGRFDVAMVDGNHTGAYLAREIEQLRRLLRPGGLLAVDDLDVTIWEEVVQTFERAAASGTFEELGRDDRVGVMRLQPGADRSVARRGSSQAGESGAG